MKNETRSTLLQDEASSLVEVSRTDGTAKYEVKCGVHKLKIFETFEPAQAHFILWATEARKEWQLFDSREDAKARRGLGNA